MLPREPGPTATDSSPLLPTIAVGGRLQHFAAEWEKVTEDRWVLSVIRQGFRITFTAPPPQRCRVKITPIPKEADQREALLKELEEMLAKKAVVKVKGSLKSLANRRGFFSTFFLTPKKSGAWRPILNLKPLNVFMRPPKFKMETLSSILPVLRQGWWGASLDLQDAYLHIPMHPSAWKWLRFHLNGAAYEFRVLPFGISAAPRTFTMVVRAVAEYLRRRGVHIFVYLDDWLIVSPSPQLLQEEVRQVCELVSRLGFLINVKKSLLSPTQVIDYLGASLDFRSGMGRPSSSRIDTLSQVANSMLTRTFVEARLFLRVLGLMASMVDIVPLCRLRMRPLQLHLLRYYRDWRHPLSLRIPLPPALKPSIKWWTITSNLSKGVPFVPPQPQLVLTTDASKQGWGAHLLHHRLAGRWSKFQASHHINALELWAVFLAIRHWVHLLRGMAVTVRSDNQTVVSYINKQGGTRSPSLCKEVSKLWLWCDKRDIRLKAVHLPGQDNTIADALSRKGQSISRPKAIRGSSVEWCLAREVARDLFRRTGRPQVDMFASSRNNLLQSFFTRVRDPRAIGVDALDQDWTGLDGYAFPPIALIPRVLCKLDQTRNCRVLLIAPWWARHPWFSQMMDLLAGTPVSLPLVEGLLVDGVSRSAVPLSTLQTLRLTAWTLSSSPSERQAFLREQPLSHRRQGDLLRDSLIIRDSLGTEGGVATGRLILSAPL